MMRTAFRSLDKISTSLCANSKALVSKANTSGLLTNSLAQIQQHPPARDVRKKQYHTTLGASFNVDEKALMATSSGVDDAQTRTMPLSTSEGKQVVGTSTTSTLEETKPTSTLEVTKYEKWTSKQVCELLCAPEEQGGASLSLEMVKPLYGQFDGTLISNIVETINRHSVDVAMGGFMVNEDFKYISRSTKEAVVYLVDNLLKTKLYHLWSADDVRNKLNIHSGNVYGNDLVKIHKMAEEENVCKRIMKEFSLEEIDANKIISWIRRGTSLKIPEIEAQRFISTVEDYRGSIPYQNNKGNVIEVGELLLNNIKLKLAGGTTSRFQKLLVNFAFYGFGKTRFGVQFLRLWKEYLTNNVEQQNTLIEKFGQEAFDTLLNAQLIYLDLSLYRYTPQVLDQLKNLIPKDDQHYFVVLDEYPTFCQTNPQNLPLIQKMYETGLELVFPIQTIPNVVGVYLCGKGAFVDLFGKFIDTQFPRSPTETHRVDLHTFNRENLIDIFKSIPKVKLILEQQGIFEQCLDEIMAETAGIPLLVVKIIMHFELNRPRSMTAVSAIFDTVAKETPERILYPVHETQGFSYKVYTFLMFISTLVTNLDPTMTLDTRAYELQTIQGLKGVSKVDLPTLAVSLGCYFDTNDENNSMRLVFPRRTTQHYAKEFNIPFSIKPFVKVIPQLIDKENIFEVLIGSFIIWKSKCGFVQQQTFGDVFPFLTGTILAKRPCIDFTCNQTGLKIMKDSLSEVLEKIYSNQADCQNVLNFMKNQSHDYDQFTVIDKDLFLFIQYKNKAFDFTEFAAEVKKLENYVPNFKAVFVICSRDKVKLDEKVYKPNSVATVPSNVTVVVLDEERLKQFIGKDNYSALKELTSSM